jgi:hypothetical protein
MKRFAWVLALSGCALDEDVGEVEAAAAAPPACTHYVSKEKQSADLPGYGTSGFPWRTINYAVNHVGPGARICVKPALYNERVEPTISGTAAAPITVVRYGAGEAIIDGTITAVGFGACPPTIGIYGRSHLRFSGFTITNRGNAGYPGADPQPCQTSGMLIMPSNTGQSSEDIIIANNVFRGIRTPLPSQIGLPLGFGSYQPGASVHHVQIEGNTFTDNDTIAEARRDGNGNLAQIWVSAVGVVGDAHDWVVRRNVFDDADTGGVELAGNQGNNLQPAYGVVSDNVFIQSGNDATFGGAGVYNQGGHHILVERNFFDRTGYAVSVHTEPTRGATGNCLPLLPAGHTLVRDNIMVNTRWHDFRTGANDNQTSCNYGNVDSVYVTNNTIYRSSSTTDPSILIVKNATAGLVGENRFLNNIIMTTGLVFDIQSTAPMKSDFNYLATPVVDPFRVNGVRRSWTFWRAAQDAHSPSDTYWRSDLFVAAWPWARAHFRLSSASTPVREAGISVAPSWYFGVYAPAELDHFGEARTSGARDIGADEF